MTNKKEIIESLIKPLMEVFGEMKDGQIEWLIKNCSSYTIDELKSAADDVIATSKGYPYPAVIMQSLKKNKYNVWKN